MHQMPDGTCRPIARRGEAIRPELAKGFEPPTG
jgi:hypothetical protein